MCDTLVAVGDVTADGAVWFGKNSDREPGEAQCLEHVGPRDDGDFLRTTHIDVPGAGRSREVVLSRPAWMWGAEMGVNDAGVAIGNEAVFTKIPLDDTGLTGMDLLRLALERAATARDAVDVVTGLLKRHGQGGRMSFRNTGFRYSSSFLIADPGEAWVLETAGRFWAAERVKGVRTISNALTIGVGADLVDDEAIAWAKKHGRCRGRDDFDFTKVFSDPVMTALAGASARRACTTAALTKQQASLQVVAGALRDHGDAGDDVAAGLRMASPCAHASWLPTRTAGQTTASLVARLAPGTAPRVWATGTSSPCMSVFKPVPLATGRLLAVTHRAGEAADGESLWWRHEALHRAVLSAGAGTDSFDAERTALEQQFVDDVDGADTAWEAHRLAIPRWRQGLPASKARGPFAAFWRRQSQRDGLALRPAAGVQR